MWNVNYCPKKFGFEMVYFRIFAVLLSKIIIA